MISSLRLDVGYFRQLNDLAAVAERSNVLIDDHLSSKIILTGEEHEKVFGQYRPIGNDGAFDRDGYWVRG